MATHWPKERRLIGKDIPRVDGPEKCTGHARYSFDINRPGMLHAVILRSPHAHCIIEKIDTKAAEGMPGVKGIQTIGGDPVNRELFYVGDEILALAATTEEQARDALRAIKVQYKLLPFFVDENDVLKNPDTKTVGGPGNLAVGQEFTRGDVDKAIKEADASHEGRYGMPVIAHQCLESHGLVAEWQQDGKNLVVWCSTQAVFGTANALANHFKLPPNQVQCITHYMGGGYGSKFGPDVQGIAAAELARKTKAPVKLMLDREEEVIAGGNRPSAYGDVKIAGMKDGTITAFSVECHGTPGYTGGATVNLGLLPYVYTEIPNIRRKHTIVRTNAGRARAMRAPGHPQNCVLTDCPLDDLAAKLGLDPMQVRLKNLPPNDKDAKDPVSWLATRETVYKAEIEIAAKMSEWKKKWHPPGQGPTKGTTKHGIGMAMHTWGGFASAQANDVTVTISRDGSVLVETSSQDLGTGQRTVNALVTAEVLGLTVADVTAHIGESQFGSSSGSGGSTTLPSQAPATLQAAAAARADFFTKIAPKLGAKPENLSVTPGKVVDKGTGKSVSWKEACAALGMNQAKGQGMWNAAEANKPENAGISSGQVGGVQIAEVWVDTETGFVRATNFWAVQDCGLIINKLACESQVAGGVIMGVNYALFEDRIMDRTTGRQVNPNMEFYKLGGIADVPRVHVHMYDMPERGTIGIGEPPTISTAAAIGNAIFNAIGVRVPVAPYSPDKVLAALEKGGKS